MTPDPRAIAGIDLSWEALSPDLGLWVAADPERVLDDFDLDSAEATDERLPYFATLWPSARAMVDLLLATPSLSGKRVLDLGCGLGATSLACMVRGAQVVAVDWEPKAIEILAASVRELGLDAEALLASDWRAPLPPGPYDMILGADLVYEPRNLEPVVELIARDLEPTAGEAWLTDPGRTGARPLPLLARRRGLSVEQDSLAHPEHEGARIDRYRLRF